MGTKETDRTARVWCGPDDPPRGEKSRYSLRLNSIPPHPNVFLKAQNISDKLVQRLPALALDLLEVAAYVYCADQSKTRGGKTFQRNGADWYRQFEMAIPVRQPDVWKKPGIVGKLKELLRFLSDDDYTFEFRELAADVPRDVYFDFEKGKPWFKPDSVLLFSGGLDSLTGAVQELQDPDRKVLLVSHRPVAKIDKAQRDLVAALRNKYSARNRLLHVPVWINKERGITKDASQRSRSFLYASIATVIAMLSDSRTIKFYENGIVSCNLPVAEQVVGARASRSTHPKSLRLMAQFFGSLLGEEFTVENPFLDKTKTDVLGVLKTCNASDLIKVSHSCTRTRSATKLHTHCGVCSQCVERRLAVLSNSLEEYDPEEMYRTRLFVDPLENRDDVVMVESYIQHARTLEDLDIDGFYDRFPDGYHIARAVGQPVMEAGQMIYDLHNRHGRQAGAVIRKQIELNAELIRTGELPPKSLLDMIVSKPGPKRSKAGSTVRFPTPEGMCWEEVEIDLVSRDSLVVRVGDTKKRYHGFDMGFRDGRRVDMLNRQWELLETLAENRGVLDWQSTGLKRPTQKRVEELNKTLKSFFGMNDNPMHPYEKGTGWVAKFQITDKSFGKM